MLHLLDVKKIPNLSLLRTSYSPLVLWAQGT